MSMMGEPAPAMAAEKEYDRVEAFEKLSAEERWAYFTKEMAKCIRCNACRNACPSCYCKICFVEQSQPQWVGIGERLLRHPGLPAHADVPHGRPLRRLRLLHQRCAPWAWT